VLLLHVLFIGLAFTYTLEDISVIGELHYNTRLIKTEFYLPERTACFIKKRLFVGGNKRIFNARQNSHFVECVFLLAVAQTLNFDLLQGIVLTVLDSFDSVNTRVRSVSYKSKLELF
jgi:hypothetical protein